MNVQCLLFLKNAPIDKLFKLLLMKAFYLNPNFPWNVCWSNSWVESYGKLQKSIEKVSHFFFHRPRESQQTIDGKVRSSCLLPPLKACSVPSIGVFKSQMAKAKSRRQGWWLQSVPGYPMMVSILVGLNWISLPTAKIWCCLCLYVFVRVFVPTRLKGAKFSTIIPASEKKRCRMSVAGASNSSSSKMGSTLFLFLWLPT